MRRLRRIRRRAAWRAYHLWCEAGRRALLVLAGARTDAERLLVTLDPRDRETAIGGAPWPDSPVLNQCEAFWRGEKLR